MLGPPHPGAQPGANDRPPPELAAHFTVVALVSQGLSWLFLGMVTACGYNHYHSAYLMVGNSAPMSDVEEYADSRGEPDVIGCLDLLKFICILVVVGFVVFVRF
ncbi:unnamed protein product [Polarella glacialis]|uniref:Uncharacterized protein n=1 Tax=Polarella glacialis TaxID=89957 RepID=A0A813IY38_POLGL|nr:unnamed protein product [Polarella glacialis]